jgi:hypothetical protein
MPVYRVEFERKLILFVKAASARAAEEAGAKQSDKDIEEMRPGNWEVIAFPKAVQVYQERDIGAAVVDGEYVNYEYDYKDGVESGQYAPIDPEDAPEGVEKP